MGMVCVENRVLDRFNNLLKLNNLLQHPISNIVALGVVVYLRQSVTGKDADIFYVIVITIIIKNIYEHFHLIRVFLEKLGSQSTNMWLTHSFFIYYFGSIAKLVVGVRWAVPCLVVLIIVTYGFSLCIDGVYKTLNKIGNILKR